MSINQLILVSQETRTVLKTSFLKTPELRKWSMDQGNLMSETARTHRIRTLLEEQRQMQDEISRGSEHYFGIIRQITGTTK